MLDCYDPWLELWGRINSFSFKESGLANKLFELCNLSELDLDILYELDRAYGDVLEHKSKRGS